jgi:hypothetical protein
MGKTWWRLCFGGTWIYSHMLTFIAIGIRFAINFEVNADINYVVKKSIKEILIISM